MRVAEKVSRCRQTPRGQVIADVILCNPVSRDDVVDVALHFHLVSYIHYLVSLVSCLSPSIPVLLVSCTPIQRILRNILQYPIPIRRAKDLAKDVNFGLLFSLLGFEQ